MTTAKTSSENRLLTNSQPHIHCTIFPYILMIKYSQTWLSIKRIQKFVKLGVFGFICIYRRLLWLNPGARGEHLTSEISWVTAWLLITSVCPVYFVDGLVLVFFTPL